MNEDNKDTNWTKVRMVQQVISENCGFDVKGLETFEIDADVFSKLIDKYNEKMLELVDDDTVKMRRSKLRNFANILLKRNLSNMDSMILITGMKGSGKSSAGIQLARTWCKVFNEHLEDMYKKDPARFNNKLPKKMKYHASKNIAYSNMDVMKKIDELPPFSPIIGDEAIEFCLAQNWAKAENKILKEKLAKVRTKHLLFILCFPLKINKIEKIYLDSFVNYWIDLFDRGKGIIFKKDLNPAVDSWRIKDFKELGSYDETTPTKIIFKKLKGHPNFFDTVLFQRVPEHLERQYLTVREKHVYEDKGGKVKIPTSDIKRSALILALLGVYEGKYPLRKLCQKIQVDYNNLKVSYTDIKELKEYSYSIIDTFVSKNTKQEPEENQR